jgi:transposase
VEREVAVDGVLGPEGAALDELVELLSSVRVDERAQSGRHDLTDEEWAFVAPFLPEPKPGGRPARPNRQVFNGMIWLLRTGAPWRDLPRDRFGPFTTVYTRFAAWRREGVLEGLVEGLLGRLNDADEIDWDLWCVDGSIARAARCAGDYPKKGGRQTSRKTTR